MAANFKNIANGIGLVPNAGNVVSAAGDIAYNGGISTLEVFTSTTETVATNINILTLTNKRLDASGSNSIGGNPIDGSTGTGNVVFSISPTLTGTINLSGQTTVETNSSNLYALEVFQDNTSAGSSYGMFVSGGTNNNDVAFRVGNAARTTTLFQVSGSGFVGVNTSLASHYLEVNASVSNSAICQFRNTNTSPGTSFGVQIVAGTNTSDSAIDVRNANTTSIFTVLGDGTVTSQSDISAVGNMSAANLSGTNTGNVSLTAIGSSPSANGATLSGQTLTLQPADSTHPGLVTSGTQTIGGNKTFSGVTSFTQVTYTTTTVSMSGSVDGLDVTGQTYIELGGGVTTLRGFANGKAGQLVIINNTNGSSFVIKNNLSTFQPIFCPSGADITINIDGSISFVFDGSRWKVVSLAN